MNSTDNAAALGQYRNVTAYTAGSASDRLQLVELLMQGALDGIASAKGHIARGDVSSKGEQISRAIALLDGLRVSLDHSQGKEVSANLERLYEYMMRRLLQANVDDSTEILDEVSGLLKEIRSGWKGVMEQSRELLEAGAAEAAPGVTGE
ncbi:MAG: flagellar export chaperone FliS [Gammaproteobacteria bacterium]|jgi:flagellar protein FliS